MAKYMLFIRSGNGSSTEYTPEQIQQMIKPYMEWSNLLLSQGRHLGGEELAGSGPVLRSRNGRIVVDGPYAETKESIGGFYMITAADEAEAIEVAKGCPALAQGGAVELRQVIEH